MDFGGNAENGQMSDWNFTGGLKINGNPWIGEGFFYRLKGLWEMSKWCFQTTKVYKKN